MKSLPIIGLLVSSGSSVLGFGSLFGTPTREKDLIELIFGGPRNSTVAVGEGFDSQSTIGFDLLKEGDFSLAPNTQVVNIAGQDSIASAETIGKSERNIDKNGVAQLILRVHGTTLPVSGDGRVVENDDEAKEQLVIYQGEHNHQTRNYPLSELVKHLPREKDSTLLIFTTACSAGKHDALVETSKAFPDDMQVTIVAFEDAGEPLSAASAKTVIDTLLQKTDNTAHNALNVVENLLPSNAIVVQKKGGRGWFDDGYHELWKTTEEIFERPPDTWHSQMKQRLEEWRNKVNPARTIEITDQQVQQSVESVLYDTRALQKPTIQEHIISASKQKLLDVNKPFKSEKGSTPLHIAASDGHLEIVKTFMTAGAEVNVQDGRGQSALYFATLGDHTDTARYLLTMGADTGLKDQENGRTALHLASINGNVDIIQLLISAKANINEPDSLKNTPLHLAASQGYADTCETLIKSQADTKATNVHQDTALISAAQYGRTSVIQAFANAKVGLDELPSPDKATALFHAINSGKPETAEALIKNGASSNVWPSHHIHLPSLLIDKGTNFKGALKTWLKRGETLHEECLNKRNTKTLLYGAWKEHVTETWQSLKQSGLSDAIIDSLKQQVNHGAIPNELKPEDKGKSKHQVRTEAINTFQEQIIPIANLADKLKERHFDLSNITGQKTNDVLTALKNINKGPDTKKTFDSLLVDNTQREKGGSISR